MAYAIESRPVVGFGLLARVQDYLSRRAAFYQTFNELSDLTDRDLADLGISRGDIRVLAQEAADAL